MSVTSFLVLLLIAAICGTIGQALVGYSVGGCLISAVVGFIGALFGSWLARQFGLPEPLPVQIGNETFPVLWSIIGSALLVAILAMVNRRRIA
jgi:uncharacterized membrane protein YeaQ/YmgE (transglycosylase-associated protein family)